MIFLIRCDQVVPEVFFKETYFVKEIKIYSKLLSEFKNKTETVNAAIILPEDYSRYPKGNTRFYL